jgi:NAD(P)-dependent dehydrogenase (short-subunit alcohol dehydrogenase family)
MQSMASIAVLGASGAIGSALARRLVEDGRSIFLLGRNHEKLAGQSAELEQAFAALDFAASRSLEEVLQQHSASCGGYQGLVNCIGSLLLKPAHSTSDDEFRQTLETNLFTAFASVRAGGKLLREQGGSVVLFASAAAQLGMANHEAVAAAKGGVIGLARSAAATYATHHFRFNVISPGLMRTLLAPYFGESGVRKNIGRLARAGQNRRAPAGCRAGGLAARSAE